MSEVFVVVLLLALAVPVAFVLGYKTGCRRGRELQRQDMIRVDWSNPAFRDGSAFLGAMEAETRSIGKELEEALGRLRGG